MSTHHFDQTSEPSWPDREPEPLRPFIGVHFACCNVYARVYRNATRTRYSGNCPKCCQRIEFRIGPGGSDRRFFSAY